MLSPNSGKITDNARTWLRAELENERYGRNVHLFDGERLLQLDFTAAFRRGEQLLPRLQGLKHDIQLNFVVWKSILESLPTFSEGRGCFTKSLEEFLAAPFLTHLIDLNEVGHLVQECRIIERLNQRYMTVIQPAGELRDRETNTLRQTSTKAQERGLRLMAAADDAQRGFRLLVDVES